MRYYEILEQGEEINRKDLLDKMPNIADIKKIGSLFKNEGGEIRLVGGCVRDALLGKKPKDVDLCTNLSPDAMIALGEKYGVKTVPTGLEHGTVSFLVNGEMYEITTLRVDTETDGRHAKVAFTNDWREDSARRDLSFNSIMMDLNGNIYDYHNGVQDLKNGVTRFVGHADARMQEDYLRILRFFRMRQKISN
jgi:tRNA nucleotidyltransferase/poly(A) polymerase